MVTLSPFAALRPSDDVVARTVDGSLAGAARAARRRQHPRHAAWLEAWGDDPVPPLGLWSDEGALLEDERPCLRVVAQRTVDGTVVVGVLGSVLLADLVPHEQTDATAVARRRARDQRQEVETRPLLGVLPRDPASLAERVDAVRDGVPETDVLDDAGNQHTVWRCDDDLAGDITDALAPLPCLLADGHHRVAAAGRDGRHRAMALVTLARHAPRLLPVWRVAALPRGHEAAVDRWLSTLPPGDAVTVHALGRRRLVGGPDDELPVETSQRIAEDVPAVSRVTTTADPAAATVAERDGAVLVGARAPTVAEILAAVAAGRALPPKSTAFSPKPRAGLVMRRL